MRVVVTPHCVEWCSFEIVELQPDFARSLIGRPRRQRNAVRKEILIKRHQSIPDKFQIGDIDLKGVHPEVPLVDDTGCDSLGLG